MKVIGVTGPIGSGKSYVSELFAQNGFVVIDTDEVYHRLISVETDVVNEIVGYFGDVRNENGGIDRVALSQIVFSDADALRELNRITHKHVLCETKRILEEYRKNGKEFAVLEVPLMFEGGFDKLCDIVISVVADDSVRLERIMKRNGYSFVEAEKRLKNQKNNEFYIAKSQKVLYNNKSSNIEVDVLRLINELKNGGNNKL